MRLPKFLCKLFHAKYQVGVRLGSEWEHRCETYKNVIFCNRCNRPVCTA